MCQGPYFCAGFHRHRLFHQQFYAETQASHQDRQQQQQQRSKPKKRRHHDADHHGNSIWGIGFTLWHIRCGHDGFQAPRSPTYRIYVSWVIYIFSETSLKSFYKDERSDSETLKSQNAHDVVLTLMQRCLDANNVVTTLKKRCVLTGFWSYPFFILDWFPVQVSFSFLFYLFFVNQGKHLACRSDPGNPANVQLICQLFRVCQDASVCGRQIGPSNVSLVGHCRHQHRW